MLTPFNPDMTPSFLSRYIGWLKSTAIWQRMVVRAAKDRDGTLRLYLIVAIGLFLWVQILILESYPILKLEELERRTGVLVGAGSSPNGRTRWISLRLQDGQIINYDAAGIPGKIPRLKEIIGQPVTVWSQNEFHLFTFSNAKITKQIQYGSELVEDYNGDVRPRMEWFSRNRYIDIFYLTVLRILPTLLVIVPLLTLWIRNRKPTEPTQPNEVKG